MVNKFLATDNKFDLSLRSFMISEPGGLFVDQPASLLKTLKITDNVIDNT